MLDQTAAPLPAYHVDAADPQRLRKAVEDVRLGAQRWRLASTLAWLDIRNRYRGSVLGPFWLTLSTGAMLLGLGLLYSALFKMSLREYLPHLAVSLVIWNAISQMVNDATTSLTASEGIIRQLPLPYTVHALRCVMRNAIIAAHNFPLILVVFLVCGHLPGPEAILAIPGFALIAVNSVAAALFLGMLCARFRDIGPIVGSTMQLAFFLTPILWKPRLLGDWEAWMPFNPFYAILETVRGPLVENGGPPLAWLAAIVYTVLTVTVAAVFFVRFRGRVAFWV
ncbi:ABC transporter permease [Falsiroseomonas selenitidurans]|uniref:ABC transporter permease n=1 Tax=Falsiroseomonas selenitidurans TaxID=2716335 RepID=A0ABX1EBX3_9PROT|nr:ABC transporter permease [Falsiroseomonas selenitidurans]NKC33372.1 ABC transporter permease [Falsiroseomonas selenitidurans]OYW09458.1 MAG: ABC transporter [Rhodospirillales bacterium 12-71-4]